MVLLHSESYSHFWSLKPFNLLHVLILCPCSWFNSLKFAWLNLMRYNNREQTYLLLVNVSTHVHACQLVPWTCDWLSLGRFRDLGSDRSVTTVILTSSSVLSQQDKALCNLTAPAALVSASYEQLHRLFKLVKTNRKTVQLDFVFQTASPFRSRKCRHPAATISHQQLWVHEALQGAEWSHKQRGYTFIL